MNHIGYESKPAVGKQKISTKYHQLVEKCIIAYMFQLRRRTY